jgi:hypothetical protein
MVDLSVPNSLRPAAGAPGAGLAEEALGSPVISRVLEILPVMKGAYKWGEWEYSSQKLGKWSFNIVDKASKHQLGMV